MQLQASSFKIVVLGGREAGGEGSTTSSCNRAFLALSVLPPLLSLHSAATFPPFEWQNPTRSSTLQHPLVDIALDMDKRAYVDEIWGSGGLVPPRCAGGAFLSSATTARSYDAEAGYD
ncbi:hypothetical protein CVT26_009336 [Gymnopilus dilepis]|uniref:Uncharacterized protein n=1 Tax=Gymnopilus dilepis TaxID=231916 RepID=A0A409YA69_9AGAR|nr:hypothetical protein CVT26_009336 [Gymnopilus dilepis]